MKISIRRFNPRDPNKDFSRPNVEAVGDQPLDEALLGDELDDFEDEIHAEQLAALGPVNKRRHMYCSHCHRMETHKLDRRKSFWQSYLTGLTFGLNLLLGPYQCTCCGHHRLKYRLTRTR